MADLRQNAVSLISSTSGIDMKTAASTTLYTVPTGKNLVVDHVVIRGNSASLAGGTSYSFTNFRQTVDLSGMTTTTGSRTLYAADNTTYVISTAATAVQITVTTGASSAGTAVVDIYGYLY